MAQTQKPYDERYWYSQDGLRLYARDYKAHPSRLRWPVICLHGLTRNSADFETVAPYVSRLDRRVLVPDMRGRGLSDYDPQPLNYHLWTYAQDIVDLCDKAGIAKAHFIGTSMGGLITMVISTLRPGLIGSAVLNDVGPFLNQAGMGRIATAQGRSQKAMKNWSEAAAYAKLRNGIAFPQYTDHDWMAFAKRTFRRTKSGALRPAYDPKLFDIFKTVAPSERFDMSAAFLPLAACGKLLVVRGALSDLLGPQEAKAMQALASDLELIEVPEIGHAPFLDEPIAKTAIERFLEAQD